MSLFDTNKAVKALLLVCSASPIMSFAQAAPKLESCRPANERTGIEGCWIIVNTPVGKLPAASVFWTLDQYPAKALAEAAKGGNSTLVEALGKTWLFTIGDKPQPSLAGTRVAVIGPIAIKPDQDYTAQYREAIMQPGAVSRTHLHSGPEIFYTETGETCLETPSGKQVSRKGSDLVVPEGQPMELMAIGAEMRRGIVLVLYPSSAPHTTLVTEWKSKGLCKPDH